MDTNYFIDQNEIVTINAETANGDVIITQVDLAELVWSYLNVNYPWDNMSLIKS